MVHTLLVLVLVIISLAAAVASSSNEPFIFHGFHGADLSLDGTSGIIEPSGLLRLTDNTKQAIGHAFFPTPFNFINSSTGKSFSFSTVFVFAIVPRYADVMSQGLAFLISPSKNLDGAQPGQYLGLFNLTNDGNSSNHIVAVEVDTMQNIEYNDIDDNHVGIDVDSLRSIDYAPASYVAPHGGQFKNLSLISGQPIRLWVDYDGDAMRLNVTVSPADVAKPSIPLLSLALNLSSFLLDMMYVGFSAANSGVTASNYILGWSFSLNGTAKELDVSKLPTLPHGEKAKKKRQILRLALPMAVSIFLLLVIVVIGIVIMIRRMIKYSEVREDWEVEYGPHRISYKDLYKATKGFRDENMLGGGGFGAVYRGALPRSKLRIAVKRISDESKQGMKEFVAEIASIGRVRHRNLVPLLGYCRRQHELLLVYDYMPNGSLDKYLFDRPEVLLGWSQRFRIIKGIAAGLLYLHEEWEQIIVHRDIKASNVLLDAEFNGRLGDFGLARLYDHDCHIQSTHVVGTLGYIAPELSRSRKPTTCSDVYAFGAFVLEVASGRRPFGMKMSGLDLVLVDWVLDFNKKGAIVEARDRRLGENFIKEEMELALKLGLLCSHPVPMARPSMRKVVQFLNGDAMVPDLSEKDVQHFDSLHPRKKINVFDDSTASQSMVDGMLLSGGQLSDSKRILSGGR